MSVDHDYFMRFVFVYYCLGGTEEQLYVLWSISKTSVGPRGNDHRG
jgi:hypothetical protein